MLHMQNVQSINSITENTTMSYKLNGNLSVIGVCGNLN